MKNRILVIILIGISHYLLSASRQTTWGWLKICFAKVDHPKWLFGKKERALFSKPCNFITKWNNTFNNKFHNPNIHRIIWCEREYEKKDGWKKSRRSLCFDEKRNHVGNWKKYPIYSFTKRKTIYMIRVVYSALHYYSHYVLVPNKYTINPPLCEKWRQK